MLSTFRAEAEYETPERCRIVEIHNTGDDAQCSIARARVAPNTTTALHALRAIEERYVILEGRGAVEVDGGAPVMVGVLDVVTIPSGVSQRITNAGQSDLVFLCICTPRFRQDAYIDLSSGPALR